MYSVAGTLLVLSTFLLSDITCSAKEHVINVNAINGSDTESCLEGITACATINMALNGSTFIGNTTLTLLISPGIYTLEYGDFNNITGSGSVVIIGSGALETIVECDPGAGLYMSSLHEVTIHSITFNGCGFGNELAISFEFYYEYGSYACMRNVHASPATLTFTYCQMVSVHNVTIRNSNRSGILLMDSRQASIVGCFIISNYLESYTGSLAVGGIVHLSSDSNSKTCTQYTLSVTHSNITDNCYPLVNEEFISICMNIQATGAIVAVGAQYLDMDIDSCLIDNNSRGLYFFHSSCNCSYKISNTIISDNQNASMLTVYQSYYLSVLELTILDSELTESDPFVMNMPYYQFYLIDDKFFSLKTSSSFFLDIGTAYAGVDVSNSSTFAVHLKELLRYGDFELRPGCKDYSVSCPEFYFVCINEEEFCYLTYNCYCYDNHNNETNLCGECIEGYAVAINSPYLECVPCNSTQYVVKGWVLLIVLEFVPVTMMIALIAILNINLNQGSLKPFVLFCQLFTIPFPSSGYPFWVGLYNYTYRIRDFALLPFTIWNLGFISFPSCNLYSGGNECSNLAICISQNTTPLGAISFWYVIAFYPFLLLAILYGYVIMYNKGYKCIVYTGRPVHRILARFWQLFDIQPSLSHTIASVYVLCFTQLAATSLKLLDWTHDYYHKFLFFYDGSQGYLKKAHGAAFFAALFVLFIFVFLPVSYLCIYPFKWFQKCFNKLKFKKDLLISVTDVFNGPYKNGTQDTLDYRYFAGIVFAIQLVQMISLSFSPAYVVQGCHMLISGLYVILIALFRPYRRLVHSLTETFAQLFLIGFSSFPIILQALDRCLKTKDIRDLWMTCVFILYFFLMVASIYCFVWIIRKVKFAVIRWISYRAQQLLVDYDSIIEEEDDEHLEFADRLMNPQRSYNESQVSN